MIKILLLIFAMFSHATFSKVLYCKQKYLPIKTEYELRNNSAIIKITAEKSLKNFEIISIDGLRGLVVNKKSNLTPQDLASGASIYINVEFTKPTGQSFLVINVKANFNNIQKGQSLPFPIGKLSDSQIQERKKEIKSYPNVNKKSGVNALESETKYHILKLPE
jgi:hypothetical protein